MNFFDHQEKARRATRVMVGLFAVSLALITTAMFFIGMIVSRLLSPGDPLVGAAWVAGAALVVMLVSSMVKVATLKGGGDVIAENVGGVRVPANTKDPMLRRYRNVVEEMALASGVPIPKTYILPQEKGINAFAAGFDMNNAVIAVTQGALDQLNRQELQAVVAHEFSHILNGDMRLNIKLIGVVHGLLVIALGGRFLATHTGGRSREAGAIAAIGILIMALGWIGVWCGKIIKASISRQREFLADASAIQFTRQNEGMSGALQKIAGINNNAVINHHTANEEMSHMFFEMSHLSGMFSTHPPILERIKRVDPSFNTSLFKEKKKTWLGSPPNGMQEDIALGFASNDGIVVVDQDLKVAQHWSEELYGLKDIARNNQQAKALLLQILWSEHPFSHQQAWLENAQSLIVLSPDIDKKIKDVDHSLLFPLVQMVLGTIHQLPPEQWEAIENVLNRRQSHINTFSTYEYCMHTAVIHSLDAWRHPKRTLGQGKIKNHMNNVEHVLLWIASISSVRLEEQKSNFNKGLKFLDPNADPKPYQAVTYQQLNKSWEVLRDLSSGYKQQIVEAAYIVAKCDRNLNSDECNVIRLMGLILDHPLPASLLEDNG